MDVDKQRLLVSALVNSRDLLSLCASILKPSYFDPTLKKTVKFTLEYFAKYKDIPKLATVRAECGIALDDFGQISKGDISYISTEVEEFCRNRAITEAIISGPELLNKGDFGKLVETLKDAVSVGLQKDLGLDYFQDPESRLRNQAENTNKISTGIAELDEALGGGPGRQELLLFAANSGGGKSMTMLNVGKNMLMQGYNGVYISLEMGQDIVASRLDTMLTRISKDRIQKDIQKAVVEIENIAMNGKVGKFKIKRMVENRTNVNNIRSYLQQLEQESGFRPDFIIVDYIDIMGTTMSISNDNLFIKDKFVTEEVRSLGFDYDCVMLSASQLGRGAIEAEKLNQAHIQGGISKINTADYVVGIKQDELMRAAGEINLEILKSRNSGHVGKRLVMKWDPISLCISGGINKSLELKKKPPSVLVPSPTSPFKPKGEGVLNLINTQ